MSAATATGVEATSSPSSASKRKSAEVDPHSAGSNGSSTTPRTTRSKSKTRRREPPKYRHVEAVHAESRPSCLSHDSNISPSFIGFRNLMVIVLGESQLRW